MSSTLYLPLLPEGTTQAMVHKHFKNAPGYDSCRVRHGKGSALIGFIEFTTPAAANEARFRMDNCFFNGVNLRIEFSKRDPTDRSGEGNSTLFVSHLPPDTTKRELGHLFRPFNGYRSMRMQVREHLPLEQRVFAFVEFDTNDNAQACLEAMEGYLFSEGDDDPVVVEFARTRTYHRTEEPPLLRTRE